MFWLPFAHWSFNLFCFLMVNFQAQDNVDPSWVRVWLLDMALAGDGKVAILMAAHNPNISQQLHYAIGTQLYK